MPPETKSAIQTLAEEADTISKWYPPKSKYTAVRKLRTAIPLALAQEKQLREALEEIIAECPHPKLPFNVWVVERCNRALKGQS